MPITPLSGSGGIDEVWGDFSGGILLFAFTHPNYTSQHGIRVIPFDGTSFLFTAPPGGTTSGLQQEADNLATLIAAVYAADTTIACVGATQTLADHSGQAPTGFAPAGSSTVAGSDGGTSLPVYNVEELVSRGADGSRWRLTLPGPSNTSDSGTGGKTSWPSLGAGPYKALAQYLAGQTNGPVHAVKTNVCTHNGVGILFAAGNDISNLNKRLRRHFKVV